MLGRRFWKGVQFSPPPPVFCVWVFRRTSNFRTSDGVRITVKQSAKRVRVSLDSPTAKREMILPFFVVPEAGDDIILFGSHWDVQTHQVSTMPDDQGCNHTLLLRMAS